MTLNTFFEKFALFADAPDAVGKMRELVLRLALHGGFSGDDSTLWKSAELGDLLEVQNGFAFKSSFFNEVRQGMPLIRIRDIASEDTQVYYSGEYRDEFIVRKGDLIIGMDGNFNIHRWKGVNALLNQRVCRLVDISPEIDQQFLFYFVQEHLDEIHRNTTYTTVKHISSKQIRAIEFPLPPLDEQKRIVAKVDELMALCDRLEAQQQEREQQHTALSRASLARFADAPTPANLQLLFQKSYTISPADLRKSILTLAVQGKLVAQDPNDEPAEELFGRIERTKEKLITERTIKRVAVEANPSGDECESLPPGWLWTRLGNSFDVRDGTHDTPKYTTEGFPLITSKNIYSGSLLFDGANLISEKDHRQISERSRVDRRDILFAMIGSIGNPVIVDTDREFSIKNVALFKYYTSADSEPRFLLLYLQLVAAEMKAKAAGGVQSFVSLGFLRNYLFPLPPLAEQRRIVAKVDQLMALVDALETQLSASRATAKNLLDALVAELTSGSQKAS
jgi:type I restriction enzyme S subunit